MKYILIPISEIDSRIEELNKVYKKQMSIFGNSIADVNISELKLLQSKGEIVEIEEFDDELTVKDHELMGYKLLKTIKQ